MILAMIALIVVLVVINVPMAFALMAGSLFYLMFPVCPSSPSSGL